MGQFVTPLIMAGATVGTMAYTRRKQEKAGNAALQQQQEQNAQFQQDAARAREAEAISAAVKMQRDQQAELDENVDQVARVPRGRRLLLASTGERGLGPKLSIG